MLNRFEKEEEEDIIFAVQKSVDAIRSWIETSDFVKTMNQFNLTNRGKEMLQIFFAVSFLSFGKRRILCNYCTKPLVKLKGFKEWIRYS